MRTSTSWPSRRSRSGSPGASRTPNYKKKIRERVPDYRIADFLAAFRYSPDAAAVFRQGGQRIGMFGQANTMSLLGVAARSPLAAWFAKNPFWMAVQRLASGGLSCSRNAQLTTLPPL